MPLRIATTWQTSTCSATWWTTTRLLGVPMQTKSRGWHPWQAAHVEKTLQRTWHGGWKAKQATTDSSSAARARWRIISILTHDRGIIIRKISKLSSLRMAWRASVSVPSANAMAWRQLVSLPAWRASARKPSMVVQIWRQSLSLPVWRASAIMPSDIALLWHRLKSPPAWRPSVRKHSITLLWHR